MIRFYHYFLIIFFASIRAQYVSQSLVLLSSQGRQFLPVKASAQLISSSIIKSVRKCFDACHANILCHIFDYGAIVSQQCRLFEGDLDTLGSIVPSLMSGSTVGTIQFTPSLFTDHGIPCSSSCREHRYLNCISNLTCQCPLHTYWNPSIGMCLVQSPVLGAPCQQNMNMCREDLNYTCLQFNQCGPISLLSGTTIADSSTLIKGSPSVGLISPVWMTLYELNGESLIVADQYAPQILHLSNVNSNNTTISALVPSNWSSGVKFYLPADVFLDIDNSYNLYVSDSGNNRIVMFHSMQTVLPPASIVVPGVAGRHSSALNYVEGPFGIKCDNQGNLIISDAYNNRIMRWAPNATSGVMIIGSGKAGNGSMELSFPNGLFFDTYNALLYVADALNNRIQLFNLIGPIPYNGATVAGGNGVGTGNRQLNQPCAIWVSNKTGTMYIVDGNNNRIQRWAKGATAGVTIAGDPNGISGTEATKLNTPSGLAINADETRMYVTDTSNDRIQLFNLI